MSMTSHAQTGHFALTASAVSVTPTTNQADFAGLDLSVQMTARKVLATVADLVIQLRFKMNVHKEYAFQSQRTVRVPVKSVVHKH